MNHSVFVLSLFHSLKMTPPQFVALLKSSHSIFKTKTMVLKRQTASEGFSQNLKDSLKHQDLKRKMFLVLNYRIKLWTKLSHYWPSFYYETTVGPEGQFTAA